LFHLVATNNGLGILGSLVVVVLYLPFF